jgi:hypothetical protein
MALIQFGVADQPDLDVEKQLVFDAKSQTDQRTNEIKNHDYGEAWREMRVAL